MDELLVRYDVQFRRGAPWPGVERADRVVRLLGDIWTGVLWSDLDETNADAVIAREVERFADLGEWEWKLYSYDTPTDLADRLRAAGFVPEETETLLVAGVTDVALESPLPAGVELRTVEDERDVDALMDVHREVFGEVNPALGPELLAEIAAGRAAAVVAYAGDHPICSGRIEFNAGSDFASLYGGGTVSAWRHRGVFRSIVAHRARLAAARAYGYLQTDASDDSRPILERLGFVKLATTTPFMHR